MQYPTKAKERKHQLEMMKEKCDNDLQVKIEHLQ